jgi:hypothetical protein
LRRCVDHTAGSPIRKAAKSLVCTNAGYASETLAPPGVGGNITEPGRVRAVFDGKVAMIGGMDQFNILTCGTKEENAPAR